jgi:hypothetical protein
MSGTFNHLLVPQEVIKIFMNSDVDPKLKVIVANNQRFIFLGANAPDFPYVAKHNKWADRMHYNLSSKIVSAARTLLLKLREEDEAAFAKCFCWSLGYLSHMTVDVTIHPIVNIIAGPYQESLKNQKKHRHCETHMDCFIYREKANELPLNEAEYIDDKIKPGCHQNMPTLIDPDIKKFWIEILEQTFNDTIDLDPDQWFFLYSGLTDGISEDNGRKISEYLAKKFDQSELMQINHDNIDYGYINQLKTPNGDLIDFLDLFDFAVGNTAEIWNLFASTLEMNAAIPEVLTKDWDLDAGMAEGESIFWRKKNVA